MTLIVETATTERTGVEMEAMVACSIGALTVYDMVKGIEPGVVVERVELLSKTGGKSDYHRAMKPLVDGHGRPIGDVRISVTDRCNFRCQYCMPAEGLPWLQRDALLTYEEITRLVALLGTMGVHDVRLTGGEPLVRRELWHLIEMLSGLEDVHDLSLTTNGYLLARQVAKLADAGLRRVNVSLDSLSADRFFQLTRRDSLAQVLEGLEAAQRHPELRPIKVNVVALRDFTEDEVLRFAEFARTNPYEVRFIEFMPLDADHMWTRDKVLPNAEIRDMIDAVYPLEPVGRERHGTARRYRFADGEGEIGFISPVTEPFCGDCNRIRITAEGMLRTCLFSLHETDLREPLRAGAYRRRPRGDRPRRRVAQGAQAPRQRPGVRPAGALDVPDRRLMLSVAEAWEQVAAAVDGAARGGAHPPRGRGRPRGGRGGLSAVDLPPFDRSAMDGYAVRAADTAPGVPLRLAGEVAAGDVATVPLEPGTVTGITTGAALPDGSDAILRSEHAEVANGERDALRGRARRASTCATAARTCAPATSSPRPGERLTLPRMSALASAGVGEVAVHRRPALHVIATGSELLPIGAPPGAGPHPRVQPPDDPHHGRARRARSSPTTA